MKGMATCTDGLTADQKVKSNCLSQLIGHPSYHCRMVEDMTARTMELTPPLIPNGSHWRLPHPSWVQQQQQASEEGAQSVSWWRRIFAAPTRFLGLVDDSLQGSEEPYSGLICLPVHSTDVWCFVTG